MACHPRFPKWLEFPLFCRLRARALPMMHYHGTHSMARESIYSMLLHFLFAYSCACLGLVWLYFLSLYYVDIGRIMFHKCCHTFDKLLSYVIILPILVTFSSIKLNETFLVEFNAILPLISSIWLN